MRRITHIHERADWPRFRWSSEALSDQLAAVRHHQGRLLGRIESLGFKLRAETTLQTLTEDALKTSEIEGERLDRDQVRSSLARRLGMEKGGLRPVDKKADAIAAVVLDATQRFDQTRRPSGYSNGMRPCSQTRAETGSRSRLAPGEPTSMVE